MIVDEADTDLEMANDPFIEAGIDVPANLPYKHGAQQERSYRKVLGEKIKPEITRKLRKINEWTLHEFDPDGNETVNTNGPRCVSSVNEFKNSTRRRSSPSILIDNSSGKESSQYTEQNRKKQISKRNRAASIIRSFSCDQVKVKQTAPSPRERWKNAKRHLHEERKIVVSNITKG